MLTCRHRQGQRGRAPGGFPPPSHRLPRPRRPPRRPRVALPNVHDPPVASRPTAPRRQSASQVSHHAARSSRCDNKPGPARNPAGARGPISFGSNRSNPRSVCGYLGFQFLRALRGKCVTAEPSTSRSLTVLRAWPIFWTPLRKRGLSSDCALHGRGTTLRPRCVSCPVSVVTASTPLPSPGESSRRICPTSPSVRTDRHSRNLAASVHSRSPRLLVPHTGPVPLIRRRPWHSAAPRRKRARRRVLSRLRSDSRRAPVRQCNRHAVGEPAGMTPPQRGRPVVRRC